MTTTLSDEEFRTLNEQLCELKNQNFNCDNNLRKALQENQILRNEIEQLRKQNQSSSSNHVNHELSNEKLKKLNPFTFAKNVAAKVDQRLHQFSLSTTSNDLSNIRENNENNDQAMMNYQMKINELELKIEKLELKNSQDKLNESKLMLTMFKDYIENYVQIVLQKQSSRILSKDNDNDPLKQLWSEAEIEPIINGQFEQNLIESLANLNDFKSIFNKFIDYFEQKLNLFENFYEKKFNEIRNSDENVHKPEEEQRINNLNPSTAINENDNEEIVQENIVEKELRENLQNLQENFDNLQKKFENLQTNFNQISEENSDLQKQIQSLNNSLSECEEDKKIYEKRTVKYMKELKKQLANEKKRADKLQNILNQDNIIDNSNINKTGDWNVDNINLNITKNTNSDRCSSTGSWTYMIDDNRKMPTSSTIETTATSPLTSSTASSSSLSIIPAVSTATLTTNEATTVKNDPEFSDLEIFDSNNCINLSDDNFNTNQMKSKSKQPMIKHSKSSHKNMNLLELENNKLLEANILLHQEKWSLEERINILERELQQYLLHVLNTSNDEQLKHLKQISPTTSHHTDSMINNSSNTNNTINSINKMINYLKDSQIIKTAQQQLPHQQPQQQQQIINSNEHKKLQRMVEEILTKNMHLQQNLELLSKELQITKERLNRYEQPSSSSSSKAA